MTDPRNVFCIDRDAFEHEMFKGEVYTRFHAWAWMLGEAAWCERTVKGQGGPVRLARGQLSHSIRFMADKWKWHKSRVERFLDALEKRDMIKRQTETGQLLITICNYSEYQLGRDSNRDSIETVTETGSRQDRDRIETKNNQGIKKSDSLPAVEDAAAPLAGEEEDDFELPPIQPLAEPPSAPPPAKPEPKAKKPKRLTTGDEILAKHGLTEAWTAFREAYPKRDGDLGLEEAKRVFVTMVAAGVPAGEMAVGARGYAAYMRRTGKDRTAFVKTIPAWLRAMKWKEYLGHAASEQPAAKPEAMDAMWRDMVARFQTPRKEWPMGFGPSPGQPGCKAPAHILAEFGYSAAA